MVLSLFCIRLDTERSLIMKIIKIIAFILTVIGALNWGLVGAFRFDLVAAIFGEMSLLTRIIYMLVGVSGFIALFCMHKHCSHDM